MKIERSVQKIFDVINVIIMIICALLCIVPVWYVICVSLSSKEAVNAGLVSFWPVGFNLLSYQKILGESDFFRSFWVSIQRVLLGNRSQHVLYPACGISPVENLQAVSKEIHFYVDPGILHAV